MLLDAGVDKHLAHIAHLFVRDRLVIDRTESMNDTIETDHFENLQSTNWQTVRWDAAEGADVQAAHRVAR